MALVPRQVSLRNDRLMFLKTCPEAYYFQENGSLGTKGRNHVLSAGDILVDEDRQDACPDGETSIVYHQVKGKLLFTTRVDNKENCPS